MREHGGKGFGAFKEVLTALLVDKLTPIAAETAARNDGERRKLLRFSNIEVVIALTIAGLVNVAMVLMAVCLRFWFF